MVLTVHREADEFEETTTVPFGAGSVESPSFDGGAGGGAFGGDANDPLWRPVVLRRNTKGSFGFGLESQDSTIGTRVVNVVPELAGKVNEGDIIVGLNGQPVVNMRHEVLVTEIMQFDDIELDVASASVFDAMFRKIVVFHDDVNGLGIDLDTEEDEVYGTMVFISSVMPDGAAAAAGAEAGDQVISCNGKLLADCSHGQIINMFERIPELVLVLRSPQATLTGAGAFATAAVGAANRRQVVLGKSDGGGFGFSLTPWEENEAEAYGAFVSEVVPGGVVARTKAIFVDDRLVEVNGVDVLDYPYDGIIGLLSSGGESPTVVVEGSAVGGGAGYTPVEQLYSNAAQVTIFRQGSNGGFGIACAVAVGGGITICKSAVGSIAVGSTLVAVNGAAYPNDPQALLAAIADAGDTVNLALLPPASSATHHTVISHVTIKTINNKCGFAADTDMYTGVNGGEYWEHKVKSITNPAVVMEGSLNPGDLILKINGQPCCDLNHGNFVNLATHDMSRQAPDGERVLKIEVVTQALVGSRLAARGDSRV